MTAPGALTVAWCHPELFEVRHVDGEPQIFVRPEAEGRPCPCCGQLLKASPLPRTEPELVDELAARAAAVDVAELERRRSTS